MALPLVSIGGINLFLRWRGLHILEMGSDSMTPTIQRGDFLIVQDIRTAGVARFDLVVFHPPHMPEAKFVMRCIGLPQEEIQLTTSGVVVNGLLVSYPSEAAYENLKAGSLREGHGVGRSVVLPHDEFFVLGDNVALASDSRVWGTVHRSNLVGVVRQVLRR